MNTYAGKNVCWRTNILPLKDIYLLFSSHLNIHTDFSPDVQINPTFLDTDFNLKFYKVFSFILETLNNKLSKTIHVSFTHKHLKIMNFPRFQRKK